MTNNYATGRIKFCRYCGSQFDQNDDFRSNFCRRCRAFIKVKDNKPLCKRKKECKYGLYMGGNYDYACGYLYYTGSLRDCSASNCDKFERKKPNENES